MLTVEPVPAFQDNYIWLAGRAQHNQVAIVDPGDARPVLAALKRNRFEPCAVLITHHHADHTGGLPGLLSRYPDLPVYGPAAERIAQVTRPLEDGDQIELDCIGARFRILDVGGHTAGHIAYYGEGVLFCGDTLFAAGCGRLFEGTPQQMHASLSRIAALPGDTQVYCAHEYTLANIGFAKWVEPDNSDLLRRDEIDSRRRQQSQPTVPSTLDMEKRTNPFLRFDEPTVIAAAEKFAGHRLSGGAEVFATIRRWKDTRYD